MPELDPYIAFPAVIEGTYSLQDGTSVPFVAERDPFSDRYYIIRVDQAGARIADDASVTGYQVSTTIDLANMICHPSAYALKKLALQDQERRNAEHTREQAAEHRREEWIAEHID